MDFSDAVVSGIPLVLLITALTQFVKEMGVGGKALRLTAACLGLAFGVAYQLSIAMPADFAGWLGVIVYGLGLGVTASGMVDVARDLAGRILPAGPPQ